MQNHSSAYHLCSHTLPRLNPNTSIPRTVQRNFHIHRLPLASPTYLPDAPHSCWTMDTHSWHLSKNWTLMQYSPERQTNAHTQRHRAESDLLACLRPSTPSPKKPPIPFDRWSVHMYRWEGNSDQHVEREYCRHRSSWWRWNQVLCWIQRRLWKEYQKCYSTEAGKWLPIKLTSIPWNLGEVLGGRKESLRYRCCLWYYSQFLDGLDIPNWQMQIKNDSVRI